jgi:phosphoglycerol transferase MdoB-like AlkP superfamily enzyme
LLIISVIWSIESWVIQDQTLIIDVGGSKYDLLIGEMQRDSVRLLINVLVGLTLVFSIQSRKLYPLFIAHLLISLSLLAFYNYFEEPLTWTIISNQLGEGVEVGQSIVELIGNKWFLYLSVLFCIKSFLLEMAMRNNRDARPSRRMGLLVFIFYLVIIGSLTQIKPPHLIRTWSSISYLGGIYGYFHTWFAERLYINGNVILEKANRAAQEKGKKFDPIPVVVYKPDHVSVIQAESLDFAALSTFAEDGPLMPFLFSQNETAVFSAIQPVHLTGSSDADFTLLMSALPNGLVAPYKVPGFDFSDSVISTARQNGYKSSVYHGNRGTFFSRRSAFRKMHFDNIHFYEELESSFSGESKWGVTDEVVFEAAAAKINGSTIPSLTMVITLTTHYPFKYLLPKNRELFHEPDTLEQRYFNSMRYLDRSLELYIEKLPAGTLVFIYGDHNSRAEYPVTPGGPTQKSTTVPLIILQKNRNTKRLQRDFDLVQGSNPSLLDVATYFRRHLGN